MRRLLLATLLLGLLAACGDTAPPSAATPQPTAETYPGATVQGEPAGTPYPVSLPPTPPPTIAPGSSDELAALLSRPDALAFISGDGGLAVASADGDALLAWDAGQVETFAWSPDGASIAFVAADRTFWLWSAEDGARKVSDGVAPGALPAWRPDSSAVAVEIGSAEAATLRLFDQTGAAAAGWPDGLEARHPLFSPNGGLLAARNLTETLDKVESPLAVPFLWAGPDAEPLAFESAVNVMDWRRAAWNADGQFAAVSNVVLDSAGMIAAQVGPPAQGLTGQVTSEIVANGIAPDGGRIAVASLVAPDPNEPDAKITELELYDRLSGARQVIWRSEPEEGAGFFWRVSPVVWSSNGNRLAFAGLGRSEDRRLSAGGVWHANGDGSGLAFVPGITSWLLPTEELIEPPQWSPDGTRLLFDTMILDAPSVFVWPADGSAPIRAIADGTHGRWRP